MHPIIHALRTALLSAATLALIVAITHGQSILGAASAPWSTSPR